MLNKMKTKLTLKTKNPVKWQGFCRKMCCIYL